MAACFRYIVDDVSAAIDFYTTHLSFKVEMHPAPGFAEISRGDMHIYLTQPSPGVGGGAKMPSGEQQKPGGWNRIHLIVDELDETIAKLKSAGCRRRQADPIGRSIGKSRRAVSGQHGCISRAWFGFESQQ